MTFPYFLTISCLFTQDVRGIRNSLFESLLLFSMIDPEELNIFLLVSFA